MLSWLIFLCYHRIHLYAICISCRWLTAGMSIYSIKFLWWDISFPRSFSLKLRPLRPSSSSSSPSSFLQDSPVRMVKFTRFAAATTAIAAMFATVAADLEILTPGGPDLWWGQLKKVHIPHIPLLILSSAVAKSQNVLSWTCHSSPYTNFTVLYVLFFLCEL